MNDYDEMIVRYVQKPLYKRIWCRITCHMFGLHKEDLYRKRQDHRVLLWVCSRCGKVTRKLKLNTQQLKLFRSVKRVY